MEYGLSLGANQGDSLSRLKEGRQCLLSLPGVTLEACSQLYETEPVDVREQYRDSAFLNVVVLIHSDMVPLDLSKALHGIEADMGRVRTEDRNAPRPIDIDIIYADALTIDTPELVLPHRRWSERRFVVQPLADVRPDLVLPDVDVPVREILNGLPASPTARPIRAAW